MPKLFLHIGQHKTATKSLQHFMANNRMLLSQMGYIYPDFGVPPCHSFARYYRFGYKGISDDETSKVLDIIHNIKREAIALNKNIIISSEIFFSNISKEKLFQIKAEFSDFDIHIICFLRRQDTYAESFYCQMIKMGESYDFKHFLRISNFDWYQNIKEYEEVFSKEKITISPFEQRIFEETRIEAYFLSLLGINSSDEFVKLVDFENQSFSRIIIEILRVINKYKMIPINFNDIYTVTNQIEKYLQDDFKTINNFFLSRSERESLYLKYLESNRMISKLFGCTNPDFFSFNSNIYPEVVDDELNSEKILSLIVDVFVKQSIDFSKVNL